MSDAKSSGTERYVPRRGDFARMVLDPYTGREQGGERPVLVLSNDAFIRLTGYALVAPITSRVRGWPFEVPIDSGLRVGGVVLTDQTRSVDYVSRHASYLGQAPDELIEKVLERLLAIVES